jgi:hypothetical protein
LLYLAEAVWRKLTVSERKFSGLRFNIRLIKLVPVLRQAQAKQKKSQPIIYDVLPTYFTVKA